MKNKLKKLLKFGLALLAIGLLLTNCEKETQEEFQNTESQEPTFTLKHFSKKNFENNEKLVSKLKQFKDDLSENKSAKYSGKSVYNKEYDFTVYTDSATYIAYGDYHSYTFPLVQRADEKITNVLFELNGQGEYDAYLVNYDYSANELKHQDFSTLSMKTSIKPIDLSFNSLFAKTKAAYVCVYSYEYVITGSHFTNGDSNLIEYDYGWVLNASYCETVYYEEEDKTTYNYNNNTATVTISGTSYGGSGGSTTSPTPSPYDAEDLIKIDAVKSELGLNFPQRQWLDQNGWVAFQLLYPFGVTHMWSDEAKAFGYSTIVSMIDLGITYSNSNAELMQDFITLFSEIPNAKLERYLELNNLLEINPWVLIQDCAQQNGLNISNYQQLYDHTLPSQCIDRLNVLGDDFENQPLSEGNAAVANVDYYGVEIITRPDINGDGVPDTNAEIFQAYKSNFSSLASGGKDNFEFSCNNPFGDNFGDVSWTFSPYFANDNSIWSSTNPLTAIFKIDASADGIPFGDTISDDGAIMISGFTSEYWIGSTITTEFSGTQPFSGNRQWGYITNLNGNLELYARAVDVARVSNLVKYFTPGSNECKEDSYYNIGEATWSNLQDEIKQFIVDNGGQTNIVPKTAIRFDKTKLKEMLESNETIDQIPCN